MNSRLRIVAVTLALAATAAVSGCSLLSGNFSAVIQPRIVPAAGQNGSENVERDFDFETSKVRLTVPVDRAVYAGSVTAEKSAIFFGKSKPVNWVGDYYRAFVAESHQTAFYGSMAQALHELRQSQGLDSSRYAELVTSMAQQLEYKVDPVNLAPKFPIETFGDGYGDCDDKALLAAALLSRDGYDVAILLFAPEKHVALGIRAPGLDYKNTGYAYVEMTEPSIVGIPAEKLASGVTLESQPTVIRIGSGTGTYGAGSQVEYIVRRMADVRSAEKSLTTEIDAGQAQLKSRQSSLDQERQALQGISDPVAAQAAVQRYNADVRAYNELTAKVNKLIGRYNTLVGAERFFAEHQYARPQVYERLKAIDL